MEAKNTYFDDDEFSTSVERYEHQENFNAQNTKVVADHYQQIINILAVQMAFQHINTLLSVLPEDFVIYRFAFDG